MDRNGSQDAGQQLEQNINLDIPVQSLEGYNELEDKLVQPAYMSQLVFKLFNNPIFKYIFFLQKAEIKLIGGKSVKRSIKLAWEVADPTILQFFNWEGRHRVDRPLKKWNSQASDITKAILANISFYLRLNSNTINNCFDIRWIKTGISRKSH
jgi:hypothetical protein